MALVLAAAMTLGTGGVGMVSALAEDPGKITISVRPSDIGGSEYNDRNETDETYIAYKIFDYRATETALSEGTFNTTDENVQDNKTNSSGISYTINASSPFRILFVDDSGNSVNGAPNWLKFTKSSNGELYVVTMSDGSADATEANAKELAKYISRHLTSDGTAVSDGTTNEAVLAENEDYYKLTSPDNKAITTSSGEVTYSNGVPRGYYLITSSLGSNLIAATSDITITEKNEYPAVNKGILESDGTSLSISQIDSAGTVAETSKSIGDTITYKLTVTIPAEANKKVVLHDIMSPNLTLITNSFRVMAKSDGTELATVPEVDRFTITNSSGISFQEVDSAGTYTAEKGYVSSKVPDSNGHILSDGTAAFEIEFKDSYIQNLNAKTTIVVTYDAILNQSTTSAKAVNNSVYLDYSNYRSPEIGEGKINIYTYQFDLAKYDGTAGAEQALLANAKFKLYRDDQVTGNDDASKTVSSGEEPIVLVQESEENSRTFHVYDNADDLTSTNSSGEFKSTSDGALTIRGLKEGTYWLEEIEAPAGYNRLDHLVKVEIVSKNDKTQYTLTVKDQGNTSSLPEQSPTVRSGESSNGTKTYSDGGVSVANNTGTELPSTGGIGTTIFYVVGGILVLGAGVLLITKRRVRSR